MTCCEEEKKDDLVKTYPSTVSPEDETRTYAIFFFSDFRICTVKLLI